MQHYRDVEKVKTQIAKKKVMKKRNTNTDREKSRGMVVLPYVEGVTDTLQRIFKKHRISTAVRPHTTIRKLVVHSKDKVEFEKRCGVVYKVPCRSCDATYIGESGRQLGTRIKEHKSEAEVASKKAFTRKQRKLSVSKKKRSAITDHVSTKNHIIDWDGVRIIDREDNTDHRKVREAIWIRREGHLMNRDRGLDLSPVWLSNITAALPGGSRRHTCH